MNQNDDLTDLLTRELHDRASEMDRSTLGLGGVQGRARSIRRRRTATAMVGAVAAVAVIVPTAAVATHGGGEPEPGPASQSPSPTVHAVPLTDLDVTGLPTGAAPHVPWVTLDGAVHLPDGSTMHALLDAPPAGVAQLDDGRLLVTAAGRAGIGSVTVVRVDGSSSTYGASSAPILSSHGRSAAWTAPHGDVEVLQVGRDAPVTIGRVHGSQAHVVGNNATCDLGTPRDQAVQGCTVWVTTDDRQTGARASYAVFYTGVVKPVDTTHLTWLTAAAYAGPTTAVTRTTDTGSCSALFSSVDTSSPPQWTTCRNALGTPSPDGKHVQAGPAYGDGLGPREIAVYTAGGSRVLDLRSTEQTQAFYQAAVWEDSEHLLLTVFQQGRWSIVRLGTDGTAELAVAPVAGSSDRPPFSVAEAPNAG